MGRPRSKVKIAWSPNFAYAIGLIVTDGNLSSDKRHMSLVSNDREQIIAFEKCLGIDNKIGRHLSGSGGKKGFRVQFGDIKFYKFLCGIGLMPNKSKIIHKIRIPNKYFFDFLRGHFDGDGSFYSYWDPRWRSSFMFYTNFSSASRVHIEWLQKEIYKRLHINGHITKAKVKICCQLKYAKQDSIKLLKKLYYSTSVVCLSRKRLKIEKTIAIVGKQL